MQTTTSPEGAPQGTDRIVKKVLIQAPRARVWRALTNHEEFGTWFRAKLDQPFEVGKAARGRITHPGFEGFAFELHVERMDKEQLFAFQWHPAGVEKDVDYSKEPKTLVELKLADKDGGTELTVVESGFDKLPVARRADAFRINAEGWAQQMENVKKHVSG